MTLPKQPSVDNDEDDGVNGADNDDDDNGDDDVVVDVDVDVAFCDGVPVQFNNFTVFGIPMHPFWCCCCCCCWVFVAIFCDGAITLGRTFIVFAFIDCFYHYNMMISLFFFSFPS